MSSDAAAASRPAASSESIVRVMRGNRGRDTLPEMRIRRAVWSLGLRYRVGARPVPSLRRTADLVFTKARVAVFVDGCYWHGCPEHYRPARQNEAFWSAKITGNRRRDDETDTQLRAAGWTVVRIWEHEDAAAGAQRVRAAVLEARTQQPGPSG
ncbi:very short patch repair endonuclease [Micromonospora matsumotoense]|nr:very short patch repair endonuclease [Micromonospora matsumotoense]